MARLRTPQALVEAAIRARSEELGVRATAQVVETSHSGILCWEERMSAQVMDWLATPGKEQVVTI